jgi:hypothetical protein
MTKKNEGKNNSNGTTKKQRQQQRQQQIPFGDDNQKSNSNSRSPSGMTSKKSKGHGFVTLFVTEGDDGVDFGGAMGGEPGGYQSDDGDCERGGDEGEGIGGA